MKPPKRKLAPPKGYIPFPVTLGPPAYCSDKPDILCHSLNFEVEVTNDFQGIVSAPGDILLLYQLGFFGKGSLSKHEPVFHDVVEQPVYKIEEHLSQISMDRYLVSTSNDLRVKSKKQIAVTPQKFIDVLSNLEISEDSDLISENDSKADSFSIDEPETSETHDGSTNTLSEACSASQLLPEADTCAVLCSNDQQLSNYELSKGNTESVQQANSSYQYDFSDRCVLDDWGNQEADEDFWFSDTLTQTNLPSSSPAIVKSNQPHQTKQNIEGVVTNLFESDVQHHTAEEMETWPSGSRSVSTPSSADAAIFSHEADSEHEEEKEDKAAYYDMQEVLILDAFEIVFLKMAFNCLMLKNQGQEIVSLEEFWRRCIHNDTTFASKYAVYHHLRAKGWIPKSGLTYGCDFMVYKKGPKYYHSSLGIVVQCCSSSNFKNVTEFNPRLLTWRKLMGINRVVNNVRKELMICFVIMPESVEQWIGEPVKYLKTLKICETLLHRVVPSRERETERVDVDS